MIGSRLSRVVHSVPCLPVEQTFPNCSIWFPQSHRRVASTDKSNSSIPCRIATLSEMVRFGKRIHFKKNLQCLVSSKNLCSERCGCKRKKNKCKQNDAPIGHMNTSFWFALRITVSRFWTPSYHSSVCPIREFVPVNLLVWSFLYSSVTNLNLILCINPIKEDGLLKEKQYF